MSTLLQFHKSILEKIHDPITSELLIIARGLGLRRIICTLLKIYDSPQNLVLLINANSEEESEIGEELGMMGCRKPGLRIIGYETISKDRQALYKKGGLLSVTSRILVVDMLQSNIATDHITGIVILHAERVTSQVLEAFIVRLYREKNKSGFLKAFTDQPEHITSGMLPLRNIMKELQIRTVHLYPRFHEDVQQSLERRRADVVELSQGLTEYMADIHHSIIQCMTTTISELKRSNTTLDLDDFTVDNSYFRSFDIVVRRQLDPVWHKVGPKTKQLVNDLGTLRRLLSYLLTYDPLQFHAYLETLFASNTTNEAGKPRQHQSPWLMTDAANIIFGMAKRRCYMTVAASQMQKVIVNFPGNEDEWQALEEVEQGSNKQCGGKGDVSRPSWLPNDMVPVLEELPKWNLLAEILQEAEEEIIRQETTGNSTSLGTNSILVMASSTRVCRLLTEYLSVIDSDAPKGEKGRKMMLQKLRRYLYWKSQLAEKKQDGLISCEVTVEGSNDVVGRGDRAVEISEAILKKDKLRAERVASRRRVRGGAPASTVKSKEEKGVESVIGQIQQEATSVVEFWEAQGQSELASDLTGTSFTTGIGFTSFENEIDTHYGLLSLENIVLVRAYSDDSDDRMLAEIQPKFIVMFEPNMEFIRRIEVYKNTRPGLAVRIYHMVYSNSCEEHKYLAGIRREKDAFEKLIKERGTMLIPIYEERRNDNSNDIIRTISTRVAGGRSITSKPPQVIVDMREFRSSLPSMLHAANVVVIPATLTVGDYILTPEICVERKSLTDLISSFNNGRLYTQCELMCAHYSTPVLLIEFEEDKAFSLDIVSDVKSRPKVAGKYTTNRTEAEQVHLLQSKIVLLVLTFPRVRIVWSSSPFATSEIFTDLKLNNPEPNPTEAISIGSDGDPDASVGMNTTAEEFLRCLPGITAKNIKHVMNKIHNVRELCEMDLSGVQEILGTAPGKECWEFIHKGER